MNGKYDIITSHSKILLSTFLHFAAYSPVIFLDLLFIIRPFSLNIGNHVKLFFIVSAFRTQKNNIEAPLSTNNVLKNSSGRYNCNVTGEHFVLSFRRGLQGNTVKCSPDPLQLYRTDEFFRALFVDRGASILFFYVRKADTWKLFHVST